MMAKYVQKIIELAIFVPTVIWLVIIGFIGKPIEIYFEIEEYTAAFRQAEAINQIFRITIFFVSAIIIVWHLFRPNKVLRLISVIICVITILFTFLYFAEVVDYRDIIYLKTI